MEQTVVLLNLTCTWPFLGLHDIWSAIMVIFPFVLFLLKWKATNRQETYANLVVSCCIGVAMPIFRAASNMLAISWPFDGFQLICWTNYQRNLLKKTRSFVISGFVTWTWFLWTEESRFFKESTRVKPSEPCRYILLFTGCLNRSQLLRMFFFNSN